MTYIDILRSLTASSEQYLRTARTLHGLVERVWECRDRHTLCHTLSSISGYLDRMSRISRQCEMYMSHISEIVEGLYHGEET